VVLAFGLIGFVTARPLMIGFAAVAGTVVALFHTMRYWRLLTPWLKVKFEFSFAVLREFMEFSMWVMVNQLGSMIFLTADLIIVNRMIGPTANGVYAALLQLVILLRAFSSAVSSVFAPAIVHMYARNDFDALFAYCARSVRVMGFALIAPVAAICAFSHPLLRIWLGEEIAANSGLLFFMTFHMCFNLAALPLISAFQCQKRVRTLGFVTCLSGLLNIGLAVLLVKATSLGMFAVAIAGMIAFTLRNSVFTPIYLAGWLEKPWYSLFFPLLRVFLAVSASVALGRSFELFWTVEKLPGLAGNVALLTVLSLAVGWFVIFNADDRNKALALVSSYTKKQG
jgi:membrane protein EpsK